MDKPLVSVIVPIYKVEDYMEECVASILAQKYTDFELILVDDGSKDKCGTMCDDYATKDERIRVIHKENGGLSSARNAGLEIAKGEFIAFVDSDDVIHADYLQDMVNLATSHKADIVCCAFTKGEQVQFEDGKATVEVQENEEIIKRINEDDVIKTVAWNKLYHNRFFKELKLRYPEGKIHEDMFLTPHIFYHAKKMVLTSRKLYFYRMREGSIVLSGFTKKRLDKIEACETRRAFYQEIGYKELFYWETESYIRNILKYYFLIRKHYSAMYSKEMNELRKKGKQLTKEYMFSKHIKFKLRIRLFLFLFNIDAAKNKEIH